MRLVQAKTLPIVGLGAGGHAKSVVEAVRSRTEYEVKALLDDDPGRHGTKLLGIPVVSADDLPKLRSQGVAHAFVAIGGVGDSRPRERGLTRLRAEGFQVPAIVHSTAIVSRWVELGMATHVLAGAIVNAGAEIGEGVIVNTGAIVEHDCFVGAYAHVAPGVRLAGHVRVGSCAHIGIGAIVIEHVRIGEGALVAAGSVVVRDVPDEVRVAGVPARALTRAEAG